MAWAARMRAASSNASRAASAAVRRSPLDRVAVMLQSNKEKREAAVAVEALDPGVPYESRWAPYVRIHGPGQGQFP
jgi:hypothetical protein